MNYDPNLTPRVVDLTPLSGGTQVDRIPQYLAEALTVAAGLNNLLTDNAGIDPVDRALLSEPNQIIFDAARTQALASLADVAAQCRTMLELLVDQTQS